MAAINGLGMLANAVPNHRRGAERLSSRGIRQLKINIPHMCW